jgi:hypothetical protein
MFEGGDVEQGKLVQPEEEEKGDGVAVKGVLLFEVESVSLSDTVNIASQEVEKGILGRGRV